MSEEQKKSSAPVSVLDPSVSAADIRKFALASALGVFLFLVPIPYQGSFTIPVGIVINWVSDLLDLGDLNLANVLVLVFTTISCALVVVTRLFKPVFIMSNKTLKSIALPSLPYLISRFIGLIVIYATYFQIGPEMLRSPDTGGSMMDVSAVLVSVVFVIAFAMPLLTDFGIMEFIGILVRKFVKALFTCPGRSAVNLMSSWLGASNAAVIMTVRQYEGGFYTGREAAVIACNFSLVSVPFCYVMAQLARVQQHFTVWYLIICIVGMIIAMITPRIWPLNKIPDTYDSLAGKQINEELPPGTKQLQWALNMAGKRAQGASAGHVFKSGIDLYLSLFLDLIPLVIAWGTIVLIVVEYTPIFHFLAIPIGHFMELLGIEHAMAVAPAMLVGFGDMYIPALMLAGEAVEKTRFIVCAVSLIQIIYMTEVGAMLVKSRVPVNVPQLFVVFLERTLLALPLVTLFANLLVYGFG